MGLNFKLDVGTLRLCLQVACQRYRQNSVIAKFTEKLAIGWNNFVDSFRSYAPVYA